MNDRPGHRPTRTSRRDHRPLAIVLVAGSVLLLALAIKFLPSRGVVATTAAPRAESSPFSGLEPTAATHPFEERVEAASPPPQLARALAAAEGAISQGRNDDAIAALNRVRGDALDSPAAYHLIGKALIGKGDFATARDFLAKAIDLDPGRAEAYFDHARASEGLDDLESALGGMRSYLHVETNNDPYRLRIAQARSAIWEWEAKLGRGPWGPTRGIPPGFTEEILRRDGKGVGVMMQKPDTLKDDGSMDYEIRAGELQTHLFKQ